MANQMFLYSLPDGGLRTRTYFDSLGQIRFEPPVYEQRYSTVCRILEDDLWKEPIKKVVEYGCAEMRLLPLLRRVKNVEHILQIDADETILSVNQTRSDPLVSDFIQRRENPLRIEVLAGSVEASVENVQNADAVIGIELIEHLHHDVLEKGAANIFGFIQPKLAIFTTPNKEFNVLFDMEGNDFRHFDHKFEWTRAEFKTWALDICTRYPNYYVAMLGLGAPPPQIKKRIGHSTQMAIFARLDMLGKPLKEPLKTDLLANITPTMELKTVHVVDFPFFRDERSKEQKIWDEAQFQIDHGRRVPRYYNRERFIIQIPLTHLITFAESVGGDESVLRSVLQANDVKVENDFIVLKEDDDEDYRFYDDTYDLDYDLDGGEDAEEDEELSGACGGVRHKANNDSEEDWD